MVRVASLRLPGSSSPTCSRTTTEPGLSWRRPTNTGARKWSSGVQLAYFTWQTSSGFTQVIPRSGLGRSAKGHRATISGWRRECRPASNFWSKPVPTVPTQRSSPSRCTPPPIFDPRARTSELADAVIRQAYGIAVAETRRPHPPQNPAYEPASQLWVISLGRLGMREFDLASDADLVFVLADADAGELQFWTRVAGH